MTGRCKIWSLSRRSWRTSSLRATLVLAMHPRVTSRASAAPGRLCRLCTVVAAAHGRGRPCGHAHSRPCVARLRAAVALKHVWLRHIYPEARKSSLYASGTCDKIVSAIKEVSRWSQGGRLKESLIEQASRRLVRAPEQGHRTSPRCRRPRRRVGEPAHRNRKKPRRSNWSRIASTHLRKERSKGSSTSL